MSEAAEPLAPNTATNSSSSEGGGASGAPAAPWYESLQDQALKTSPSIQKFKDPEALAKSFVHMEKRLGVPADRLLTLPADPNDKEGMRALYAKLGLPEKADGYGLNLGEKATDADKALVGKFAERMHAAGAPAQFVKEALAFFQETSGSTLEQATAAREEAKTKAVEGLKTEWGAKFDENNKAVGQLLNKFGSPELEAELGATNIGNNPQLARALAKIAEAVMEPSSLQGDNRDAAGLNRPMTPAQAQAAVAALTADPIKGKALRDKMHPMHMGVVKERSRLLAMADGREA